MGQPLFQLNDTFISSVCYGMDDDAVEARLIEALEAGRQVARAGVQESMKHLWPNEAQSADVVVEQHGFTVTLPDVVREYVLSVEYGMGGGSPAPSIRQGLIGSRIDAQRAISSVLEQR